VEHQSALVGTLAAAFVLAFGFGFVANWFRLPAVVGYLIAGVALGPFTPGFVADAGLASQLAEFGVILLMFGVGLHFSPRDLKRSRHVALPGALIQIVVAATLGALLARAWGWPWSGAVVFGFSLSVASTVVVLRALEPKGIMETPDGRLAVGWLVVEDLAMVLVLVLVPALAPAAGSGEAPPAVGATIAWTLLKVAAFGGVMALFGQRVVPAMLTAVARRGSRELFMLGVLAVALGIALGAAQVFGVSFALGAFVAGFVVGESDLSHQAAAEALPLQDAFAVLFFVSVGMLVDPRAFASELPSIGGALAVILVGQSLCAALLMFALGRPLRTALTLGAAFGQIGELSFIVIGLGVSLGLVPPEGRDIILGAALVSVVGNPALFALVGPVERFIEDRPRLHGFLVRSSVTRDTMVTLAHEVARLPDGHAVIVGYGRVGHTVGEILRGEGMPFIVVERDRQTVEDARDAGIVAIFGDAASKGMLRHAHIGRARLLVVTAPEPLRSRRIIDEARAINPDITIVVRAHSEEDVDMFNQLKVGRAVLGERELAFGISRYAVQVMRQPRTPS